MLQEGEISLKLSQYIRFSPSSNAIVCHFWSFPYWFCILSHDLYIFLSLFSTLLVPNEYYILHC